MWLYSNLLNVVPPFVARILMGFWFAILIVLVLFFIFEPEAEFRYGKI